LFNLPSSAGSKLPLNNDAANPTNRRARARQKRDLIYSLLFLPAVFVTFHDKVVEVRFHKAQPERDEDELGETRLLLVNKFDPIPQLSRGELITIASPNDPGVTLVRRLVALPGDSILTRPTRDASSAPDWIYPFAVRAMPTRNGIVVTVPRGKVWVESPYGWESDSNTFGPVCISVGELDLFFRDLPPLTCIAPLLQ
jgi:hypothetical protein